MPVIEIEADSPSNWDIYWEPTQDRVRGRFLPARVKQEAAGRLAMALPDGLPGQRIRLDTDRAEGAILEPLAEARHAATRVTVARLVTGDETATADRVGFAPAVRITPNVHVPTWLAYMVKAVRAGLARVTVGTLPDEPPADAKPRVFSSLSQGAQPDAKDATIDTLTKLLMAKLSPAEQRQLAATLGK